MAKTPEQLAEEYADNWHKDCDYPAEILRHTKKATETVFLAGYQAAKDEDKAKLQNLEANWKFCCEDKNRLIKELAATERALDKVTDADKVMPQWISVKERLPEYDQLALLWQSELQAQFVGRRVDSGLAFPLYYWECTSDFFEAWKEIYYPKLMHQGAISHWMPLPEPPKE